MSSISMRRSSRAASRWPPRGRAARRFADLADRQLRRRDAAAALPEPPPGREARLPDPGFARFRGDGEAHLFSPKIAGEIQALATIGRGDDVEAALAQYRGALARPADGPSVPRDELRVRRRRTPLALDDVEDARSIVRRFVVSAMSVGALSPEAHQALTIGIQRAGGSANTGEGGEDPAWYVPGEDGRRRDARIKQVASARFGVTATYLARADQLEIKISQGSKPGEGGQLPGRKATAYIAVAPARPGRPELHQPAAAPRHLLDRGPGPAHRRPAGDQPARPDRREARREPRRRDGRRGCRQGRRLVHPPVRACRRDRRVAAVVHQARRRAVGARPGRGPPDAAPQRPARPRRAAHGRRPPDRPRPARRGPHRRRGVRVRDGGARRRSAATWPANATSIRARPASPPSARTCGPSSPARPR